MMGLTFVLVITGKGKAGSQDAERGVLRRQVPEWLSLPEFRALVVGFEEAHIGHGGEGRALCAGPAGALEHDPEKCEAGSPNRSCSLKRPNYPDAGDHRDDPREDAGLAIVRRDQRDLLDAGSIFTACSIRNMQTAQFEIQRE